jgi:methylmalonic aciduria homocystinuria type C protein
MNHELDEGSEITRAVAGCVAPCGLDLVHAFDAARYNQHITEHATLSPLPLHGRQRALGVLIGNTRALWLPFVEAYRASRRLRESQSPLELYLTETLQRCVDHLQIRSEVRFAHEGPPRLVSMLHLAEASGFAHTGPVNLGIHHEHGPWFALRAVLVADADPPRKTPEGAMDLCSGCPAPCRAAMDRALAHQRLQARSDIASNWQMWVAVRDACPVGRGSRYSEDQIRYHYTKDRTVLLPAAGKLGIKSTR